MTDIIGQIIEDTIALEGRYSDNPNDTGGKTMFGITERVARRNGFAGDMRALTRTVAIKIYRDEYAVKPGFASVAKYSQKIAAELFDTGVNMGPSVPSLWLQQALNALNDGARLYPDIKEDGDVGVNTLIALGRYMTARGPDAEKVMLKCLNALQGARYLELARGRGANETFLFGWLRTRVEI